MKTSSKLDSFIGFTIRKLCENGGFENEDIVNEVVELISGDYYIANQEGGVEALREDIINWLRDNYDNVFESVAEVKDACIEYLYDSKKVCLYEDIYHDRVAI